MHSKKTMDKESLYSVYVGHLYSTATKRDLHAIFKQCGNISSTYVAEFLAEQPYIFGFVRFADPESALNAVREMDQWTLKGRKLKVELASETKSKMIAAGYMANSPPRRGKSGPPPKLMEKTRMSMDHLLCESRFRDSCIEINIQQGIGGYKLDAEKILCDVAKLEYGTTPVLHGDLVGAECGNITYIKKTMMKSEEDGNIPADSTKQFFEMLQGILENVIDISREDEASNPQSENTEQPDQKSDTTSCTSKSETENQIILESEIVANLASAIKKTSISKIKTPRTVNEKPVYEDTVMETKANSFQNIDTTNPVRLMEACVPVVDLAHLEAEAKEHFVSQYHPVEHSSSLDVELRESNKVTEVSWNGDGIRCISPPSSSSSDSETERYHRFLELTALDNHIAFSDKWDNSDDSDNEYSTAELPQSIERICMSEFDIDSQNIFEHTHLCKDSRQSVAGPANSVRNVDLVSHVTTNMEKDAVCRNIAFKLKQMLHISTDDERETQEVSGEETVHQSCGLQAQGHVSNYNITDPSCISSPQSVVTVTSQPSSDHVTSTEIHGRVTRDCGSSSMGRGLGFVLDKLKSKSFQPGLKGLLGMKHSLLNPETNTGCHGSYIQGSSSLFEDTSISKHYQVNKTSQDSVSLQERTIRHRKMRPKTRENATPSYSATHPSNTAHASHAKIKISNDTFPSEDMEAMCSNQVKEHTLPNLKTESNPDKFELRKRKKSVSASADSDIDNMAADSGVESDSLHHRRNSPTESGHKYKPSGVDRSGDGDEKFKLILRKAMGRGRGWQGITQSKEEQ